MALSIIFTTYTRNGFKKLQRERTFIPCKTSFEKCLSAENNLVLKFGKAILKK